MSDEVKIVSAILERARIEGGWDDETVAISILVALGRREPEPDGEEAMTQQSLDW